MIIEASNLSRSGAGRLTAVADHLSDCEEYTLDIVAHMKKVEVLVHSKTCHRGVDFINYYVLYTQFL